MCIYQEYILFLKLIVNSKCYLKSTPCNNMLYRSEHMLKIYFIENLYK